MREKFYFFDSFRDTINAIEDEVLQAKYMKAIIDYGITWEYDTSDEMVNILMVQTKFTMDRSIELSDNKSEKMKWNQNAVKNWEKQSKQTKTDKNRVKQSETDKNRTKQKKQEEEVEVEEEVEKENNKLSISNDIDNSEAETFGNQEINNLISELKEECNKLGVAYEKKDERNFAKHILTAKDYGEFAEKIWQSRVEFAKNVLFVSWKIWFFKWICAWPKSIYQNYAEVYNEAMKTKLKAKTIPKF